jgi:archaemetzincin
MNEGPSRIFVLPMGDIPEAVLRSAEGGLEREFSLQSEVLAPLPVPVAAFNTDRRQYLSIMIIEEIERLLEGRPLLAVCNEDIYAQGLNFIFGEADAEKGIAIISTARLSQEFYGGSPDLKRLYERVEKEAVHEVGHLMGIPHCKDSECVMRYSNTISHTDRKSANLCPHCRMRLGLKSMFQ